MRSMSIRNSIFNDLAMVKFSAFARKVKCFKVSPLQSVKPHSAPSNIPKAISYRLSAAPPPVSAKQATWMQSALMWADMFIKLGLVSGCSEYCRRQSRPCGARGESARDEGRDRERESAGRERLALWRLIWTLPYSAVFLSSSTKLSNTKGFCSCICFALRVVLK